MNNINDILIQNDALIKENARLKEENRLLKCRLMAYDITLEKLPQQEVQANNARVHSNSSVKEKIDLYCSLFRGRDDVFAKRWHNIKTGQSGYQPVCENEWDKVLCDKRKHKCSTCPNRKLSQLTEQNIYNHLSGKDEFARDVIGIYPMLIDETCYFLAVDFDDGDFKKDVLAF